MRAKTRAALCTAIIRAGSIYRQLKSGRVCWVNIWVRKRAAAQSGNTQTNRLSMLDARNKNTSAASLYSSYLCAAPSPVGPLPRRLSHASLSTSSRTVKLRMAHQISYGSFDRACCLDNCENARANTCIKRRPRGRRAFITPCFYGFCHPLMTFSRYTL